MKEPTIRQSAEDYLNIAAQSLSHSTIRSYREKMEKFLTSLARRGILVDTLPVSRVSEDWIALAFEDLKHLSASTQRAAYFAILGYYRYLSASGLARLDVQRAQLLVRPQLPKTPRVSSESVNYHHISRVVDYALSLSEKQAPSKESRLRQLRDRALIVILADTGIEVSALCGLRRGNLELRHSRFRFEEAQRGQSTMSFPPRVRTVLLDYLDARSDLDLAQRVSLSALPLLARHNPRTEHEVLPLSTRAAGKIVRKRSEESLGAEFDDTITPKSFRRYFVSSFEQPLSLLHPEIVSNCEFLFEHGRYDEAIFGAMKSVEERIRLLTSSAPTDIGVHLVSKSMQVSAPLLRFSSIQAEQEAIHFLFRGAIGAFKNPLSHRSLRINDPAKTFECLALASMLMRMLDDVSVDSESFQ